MAATIGVAGKLTMGPVPSGCVRKERLSFPEAFAIFRRSDPFLFLEHAAEVLGIFESELVGYLRDARPGRESVFRPLNDVSADMVARRVARCLFDRVSEVVGRHAQPVGAILYGRYAERKLFFLLEIVSQIGRAHV